jgi:hypothetical protein
MNPIADAGERPVTLSDLWIRMARGAVGRGNERVFLAGCDCAKPLLSVARRLSRQSVATRSQKGLSRIRVPHGLKRIAVGHVHGQVLSRSPTSPLGALMADTRRQDSTCPSSEI